MGESSKSQQTDNNVTIRNALGSAGALIAIAAPASIVISFVYDWGFFHTLGISFQEAPTTTIDHIRSWLVWFPRAIMIILGGIALKFCLRRFEKGLTDDEIVSHSPDPQATRNSRDRPYKITGFLGIFLFILWLIFGSIFSYFLVISVPIIWFIFSIWVFNSPLMFIHYSGLFKFCFCWTPIVLFGIFFLGQNSAMPYLNHQEHVYGAQLNDSVIIKDSELNELFIIRTFDKWILVQNRNRNILWVPSNRIYRVKVRSDGNYFQGIACLISRKLCLHKSSDH